MKDSDKILINTYLDGEATADETKVVEQLLKSDEEAQAYMQGLQEINLKLTAFSNNEELRDLKQWTTKYVEENVREQANVIAKTKVFFENLFSQQLINYSLTAAVFFGIGTQFIEQPLIESEKKYSILKMRSSSNVDSQIILILDDMIENNTSSAQIDSSDYERISIFPSPQNDCILFEIVGTPNLIGKYCYSDQFFTISEID
jgi:hypothetical protein